MLFGEFDPELEKKVIREEALEEGRQEGQEILLKKQISKKLAKGFSCLQIAQDLEEDVKTIQRLMKQLS